MCQKFVIMWSSFQAIKKSVDLKTFWVEFPNHYILMWSWIKKKLTLALYMEIFFFLLESGVCFICSGSWPPVEGVSPASRTAGGTDVWALKIRVWHIKEKWQRSNSKQLICLVSIPLLLSMLASDEVHVAVSGATGNICSGMIQSVCISMMWWVTVWQDSANIKWHILSPYCL